jgi:type I restriction enzyme, S subunit
MYRQEWQQAPLRSLLVRHYSGAWGEEPADHDFNALVLRSTNLDDDGNVDLSTGARRSIPTVVLADKQLKDGDILLEASGGGPGKPVGRVAMFLKTSDQLYLCSNFFRTLRFDNRRVAPPFMAYLLHWLHGKPGIMRYQQQTTGIINLRYSDYLDQEVPLPPLAEQRRITDILASADANIAATQSWIGKLESVSSALAVARLADLAADAQTTMQLSSVATVSSGVTLGSEPNGSGTVEVPYLRVANVQDGYVDTSEMKTIRILRSDLPKYLLRKGDVLLTEGGDLDKLGRGSIWDARIQECICQNHIFRVRCDESRVLPGYLSLYIGSPMGKVYFLKIAKQTTNLASINSTQLKQMPLPIPNVRDQASLIELMTSSQSKLETERQRLTQLQLLKQGLMDDLLTGRLQVTILYLGVDFAVGGEPSGGLRISWRVVEFFQRCEGFAARGRPGRCRGFVTEPGIIAVWL